MNKQIVDYLQKNKSQYTQISLVQQLKKAGYNNIEIQKAVEYVYGDITTPSDNTPIHYAGFWVRFAAQLIDICIVAVISGIPALIIISIIAVAGAMAGVVYWCCTSIPDYIMVSFMGFLSFISIFIFFVVYVFYFVFMTNKRQNTIGKRMLGIEVCDVNTLHKAPLGRIWKRQFINGILIVLLPLTSFVTPFVIPLSAGSIVFHAIFLQLILIILFVACFMIAIKPKKQGIHDLAAKTVVIYKNT